MIGIFARHGHPTVRGGTELVRKPGVVGFVEE
jgi:hypothetical protein